MSLRRIASVFALATGVATPALAAVAYPPCALYISSRIDDEPVAGVLIGWAEITTSWGWGHTPFSETHYEGYYETDRGMIRVDCQTYTLIG